MKKYVLALMLIALAGCQTPPLHDSRAEAYKRWNHTRAQMLYGVGLEHLKVGQLDRAAGKAAESLALDPEYVEARLLLGKVYLERGNYAQAVGELAKVRQQLPTSAEAVYLLAVAQEKNGQLEEALENYRLSLALDEHNTAAVAASAEVLVGLGRVQESQQYVDLCLETYKEDPALFEIAGRLAMMSREYAQAARHFQRAGDLDDKNLLYRESLARAQFLAGQYKPASETLTELTQRAGYTPGVWAYSMLGDCYLVLERPYDARTAFDAACRLKPADASLWANLAKSALACRDMERAVLAARQALDLDPGHLEATQALGYALLRSDQAAQAVDVLKRGIELHPENGTLRYLLGRAYATSGDEAQAVRCYGEAVRLDPDNSAARELLAGVGKNGSGLE